MQIKWYAKVASAALQMCARSFPSGNRTVSKRAQARSRAFIYAQLCEWKFTIEMAASTHDPWCEQSALDDRFPFIYHASTTHSVLWCAASQYVTEWFHERAAPRTSVPFQPNRRALTTPSPLDSFAPLDRSNGIETNSNKTTHFQRGYPSHFIIIRHISLYFANSRFASDDRAVIWRWRASNSTQYLISICLSADLWAWGAY